MTGALIILAVTAAVGLLLWILDRRRKQDETPAPTQENSGEQECCGKHIVCEKSSLAVMTTDIEYFDDEELDAYAGVEPQEYTAADIDRFLDVLLTMKPDEVPAWARSLQLRGIEPPPEVREHIIAIASELRS